MTNNTLLEELKSEDIGRLFLRLASEIYKDQNERDSFLRKPAYENRKQGIFQTHFVEMIQKKYSSIDLEYRINEEAIKIYLADNFEIMDNYLSERPKGSICTIISNILEKEDINDAVKIIGNKIKNNPEISIGYEKPGNSKRARRKQVKYYDEVYNQLKQDLKDLQ